MFDLPLWVYVGFAAQFLWVASILIDKYILEKYFQTDSESSERVGTLFLISAFFSIFISLLAIIVAPSSIVFQTEIIITGLCAGVLNGAWLLLYLYAIDQAELSRTIPIFQTVPIFGLLFAYYLLGETISLSQGVAACIILLGAFALSYNFSQKEFDFLPFLLMLIASVLIGLMETIFKLVSIDSDYWNSIFWLGLGFSLLGLGTYSVIPKYRRQFNQFIREREFGIWKANSINEVVDTFANLVFIFAITLGPIALVQSMNAYQPLLILIASYVASRYFRVGSEDVSIASLSQKIIAISIMLGGSVWLYTLI